MITCKECKWWEEAHNLAHYKNGKKTPMYGWGECKNQKVNYQFVDENGDDKEDFPTPNTPKNQAACGDILNNPEPVFTTGENFGCIHGERKEEKI